MHFFHSDDMQNNYFCMWNANDETLRKMSLADGDLDGDSGILFTLYNKKNVSMWVFHTQIIISWLSRENPTERQQERKWKEDALKSRLH